MKPNFQMFKYFKCIKENSKTECWVTFWENTLYIKPDRSSCKKYILANSYLLKANNRSTRK